MNGDLSMALCLFAWCYFLACPVIVDSFLWAARASENCNKSVRNKNTVTLDTLYMTPGSDGKKGFCLVPDYMVSRPWPCFRSAFYFSHHHSKILRKYFTLQRGLNWPLLWKCHEYSLLDQLLKFYEMKTIIVHEDKCVLKIRFFFQRWRKFKSWEIFGSISNVGSPRLSQPVHSETAGTSWILRSWNWIHMWSVASVYTTQSNWYAQSNTLKPDRPQPDQPAACHRPAVFSRHRRLTDARKTSARLLEILFYFVLFFKSSTP